MPMYTFYNDENKERVDRFFKIADRPETIDINGLEYHYIISMPAIVSGVGGLVVPSNLKEKLTQLKKFNPDMKSSVV